MIRAWNANTVKQIKIVLVDGIIITFIWSKMSNCHICVLTLLTKNIISAFWLCTAEVITVFLLVGDSTLPVAGWSDDDLSSGFPGHRLHQGQRGGAVGRSLGQVGPGNGNRNTWRNRLSTMTWTWGGWAGEVSPNNNNPCRTHDSSYSDILTWHVSFIFTRKAPLRYNVPSSREFWMKWHSDM